MRPPGRTGGKLTPCAGAYGQALALVLLLVNNPTANVAEERQPICPL